MHKYKMVFTMATGDKVVGYSTDRRENLEQFVQGAARADRQVCVDENGMAVIVNMRHVAALAIREVWR